jgi:hypothetical protein
VITPSKFKSIQELFFKKVALCCNPSSIKLIFVKVASQNDYDSFTGDGERSVDKEVELKCFYLRNISDKQREKTGVSQEVTDIVYVSPLDLERKTGSMDFPDYIKNAYSNLLVDFVGSRYSIVNIKELEPMQVGNKFVCLAYQLNLKRTSVVNSEL